MYTWWVLDCLSSFILYQLYSQWFPNQQRPLWPIHSAWHLLVWEAFIAGKTAMWSSWLVVGELLNIRPRKMNNVFLLFRPSFCNFCFRLVRCYMRDCCCRAHVRLMILLRKRLIFSLGGICCCLKNSFRPSYSFFFEFLRFFFFFFWKYTLLHLSCSAN